MKKLIWILIIVFLVSLAACQGQKNVSSTTDNNEGNKEHQETTAKQDKQKTDEEKQSSDKQDKKEKAKETSSKATEPTYRMKDNWYLEPINGETDQKAVLLTIDDAPGDHALEMAKTLKKLDVKAIFFVNGHFLEDDEKKEKLKKIYDMGFTVGNHTYSHAFLPDISAEEQKKEILQVNDMVEEITGQRPQFFRAPNGANTDVSRKLAEEEHMTLMNWSYGYDFMPEYEDKEKLTNIMLHTNLLGNGANLLMHDRDWTNAALEDIVTGLKKKGYSMINPEKIERVN